MALISEKDRQLAIMCLLMREHNATYSSTKEVEPESDPASNLKGMQRTEEEYWISPRDCN